VRGLVVGRDHVGRVPPALRRRGALHHHQPDGGRRGQGVRGVLLGGVFAPAVVHDARYQEDEEQDDVAGDEDAEVQGDGVDLLVVFQKAHGARLMPGGPRRPRRTSEGYRRLRPDERHWSSLSPPCPLKAPSLASASRLSVSQERRGYVALR